MKFVVMARVLHTFIREIVTKAKHKLGRRIAVFLDQSLRDFTLVDEPWSDFKIRFAHHDFDVILLSHRLLKMLLALAGLECAILWISSPVVPGQSNLLPLNEGAY